MITRTMFPKRAQQKVGRAPLKTNTGQIVNSVEVAACEAQRQDAIALFGRTVRLVSLIMETIVISRSPKNE